MKHFLVVLSAIALAFLASCDSRDFTIRKIESQPFMTSDGCMALALYASVDESDLSLHMVVHDPSGDLTWELDANEVELDSQKWHGSSDITMPYGTELPCGTWTVDYVSQSGRKVSQTFEISYDDQTVLPTSL